MTGGSGCTCSHKKNPKGIKMIALNSFIHSFFFFFLLLFSRLPTCGKTEKQSVQSATFNDSICHKALKERPVWAVGRDCRTHFNWLGLNQTAWGFWTVIVDRNTHSHEKTRLWCLFESAFLNLFLSVLLPLSLAMESLLDDAEELGVSRNNAAQLCLYQLHSQSLKSVFMEKKTIRHI